MILADENIVSAIVARLRADGWDVAWVAEVSPSMGDPDVLARTAREALMSAWEERLGTLVHKNAIWGLSSALGDDNEEEMP